MSKMTFTSPRATLEETLAFANAVREAGGANPLDALMPAVPSDPKQCLIARNLNFNCEVRGLPSRTYDGDYLSIEGWGMFFGSDKELRDKIAAALELQTVDSYNIDYDAIDGNSGEAVRVRDYAMVLPPEVGKVASDFDAWSMAISGGTINRAYVTLEEIERLRTFGPYIEESIRESKAHGVFNERGELLV